MAQVPYPGTTAAAAARGAPQPQAAAAANQSPDRETTKLLFARGREALCIPPVGRCLAGLGERLLVWQIDGRFYPVTVAVSSRASRDGDLIAACIERLFAEVREFPARIHPAVRHSPASLRGVPEMVREGSLGDRVVGYWRTNEDYGVYGLVGRKRARAEIHLARRPARLVG